VVLLYNMLYPLKNIAFCAIAGLLLFNTVGGFALLKWQEHSIEECFEEALKTGKIESTKTITFTTADLLHAHWENNHEIQLNGRYYDLIVKSQKADGTEVYEFIADEDETELYYEYKGLFKSNKSKNAPAFAGFAFYFAQNCTIPYSISLLQCINTPFKNAIGQSHLQLPYSPPKA
jgi:hypothetical protein